MAIKNKEVIHMSTKRQIAKIIEEVCEEYDIKLQTFSYDWVSKLEYQGQTMFIYGYKFPHNNAAVENICNDKAALSAILDSYGIPNIPHHFFISPNNKTYIPETGSWKEMSELLDKYGEIVCKANAGTGGRNMFRVDNQRDLELAIHEIFMKSKTLSIAPYKNIGAEYRVIVSDSKVGVIYEKKRPFVIGNGIDTVEILIERDISLREVELDRNLDLNYIPELNEKVEVSWKHNLRQGSKPFVLTDENLKYRLSSLALTCAKLLDIDFVSIDIVNDEDGLEILEINSGVMLERFAKSSAENYAIAKEIYKKAILKYFKIEGQN